MISKRKDQSVRHKNVGRFLAMIGLTTVCFGCTDRQQQPIQIAGEAQGTYYSVQYYDAANRNLRHEIDSLLDEFDQTASLWVENSLIRRINQGETDSITPLFADMLQKSLSINEYTNGAFDCRIGRLVQTWGFSFKEREEPDSARLSELLRAAHGKVSIEGARIVRECAETELDFNAIAQGYSVDMLASMMDSLGIESYLIDVGGEVIAHGTKPNGSLWRVGIERPAKDQYSAPEVQTAIGLKDCSIVTSGNYRKYYERDGVKYSHTIDPATGRPVQHSLLSASVVEQTSWLADAMATAYMVMGLDKAKQFIADHRGEPGTGAVMFIYDSAGAMRTYTTPEFEKLQTKH